LAVEKIKFKLSTSEIEEAFFEDTALISINCDKPVYVLCHMLNIAVKMQFERKVNYNITIGRKSGDQFTFPVYQSFSRFDHKCHTLYKIKSEEVHLLPHLRNFDYLWLVRSDDPYTDASDILKQIRQMKDIQFAGLLDKEKIKNLDYLIL
jgi:hypothetical protein